MDKWRGFGRSYFPIALFVDARAEIPLLGPFLDDKRRATLRTRLGNRFVRSCEIAIRITAAAVEDPPGAASLDRAAPDKLSFIALGALNP
jgi:hypothetical protein